MPESASMCRGDSRESPARREAVCSEMLRHFAKAIVRRLPIGMPPNADPQRTASQAERPSLPRQGLQQPAINQSAEMRDDASGECTVANQKPKFDVPAQGGLGQIRGGDKYSVVV